MSPKSRVKRGPTLEDVANEAGVSQTTVSYVLSNSEYASRISADTQDRILAAARRLGYSRNYLGAALQRGYSNTIVLLAVSWNLATGHTGTIVSISQAAAARGLQTIIQVVNSDTEAERFLQDIPSLLPYGLVLLWEPLSSPADLLGRLRAGGLPIVDLMPLPPDGFISVTADREMAGYISAKHLLELGHRKIAMMLDTKTRWRTSHQKHVGYCRALKEAGIEVDDDLLEETSNVRFEGGREGLPRLLHRRPDVTALVCINDSMALGAVAGARDMGLCVPEDISVVGYAAMHEGTYFTPQLTSVSVDSGKIAGDAVDTLVKLREGTNLVSAPLYDPVELVVRESSGPVRSEEILSLK